jgi:hypothetical protein
MGDNYVGFLHARYEPGNPSLTNFTTPSPPTPTNTTATTNTNAVVGAVVGANFAQVAVIILGILHQQGKLTFDFCGFFRKMCCSLWRKTKDEIEEELNPKPGDDEGEFNFSFHISNTMFSNKTHICGYNQCLAVL